MLTRQNAQYVWLLGLAAINPKHLAVLVVVVEIAILVAVVDVTVCIKQQANGLNNSVAFVDGLQLFSRSQQVMYRSVF